MRAILEFDLPKDQSDFDMAQNGIDWYCTVWDLDQWLREQVKYQSDKHSSDTLDAFDEVRGKIRELLNDRGLRYE